MPAGAESWCIFHSLVRFDLRPLSASMAEDKWPDSLQRAPFGGVPLFDWPDSLPYISVASSPPHCHIRAGHRAGGRSCSFRKVISVTVSPETVVYYITPHGFGHAVRSLEIIRNLMVIAPSLHVVAVSDIPSFLIEENVGFMLPYRRKQVDIGLVQLDSLRFDLDATWSRLEALRSEHDKLIKEETAFLASVGATAVVSDIAFLPFHAAKILGIPGIGIGNFTWDWVYSYYARSDPKWTPLVEWIRSGYRKAELFLQLPMHGDCSVFERIEPVPLVARHARLSREEARQSLGVTMEQRAYLIAFASLDLDRQAQARLEAIEDAAFLFKQPLHFHFRNGVSLDSHGLSYADVVGAVNAVITKPGYGIVSDCLAHRTPMIYCDRGDFPEYPILVEAMEAHLPTVYMPSKDLVEGRWEAAVQSIPAAPSPERPIRTDGARVCAERILRLLTR